MMGVLVESCIKYKQLIFYVFFGILTTIINFSTYFVCTKVLNIEYIISNVIAWIIAVLFAFITNKLYVFESKVWNLKVAFVELIAFISSRILSGIMDTIIMYIFIDILKFYDMMIKVLSCILVIIANYVLSKVIFRKNIS